MAKYETDVDATLHPLRIPFDVKIFGGCSGTIPPGASASVGNGGGSGPFDASGLFHTTIVNDGYDAGGGSPVSVSVTPPPRYAPVTASVLPRGCGGGVFFDGTQYPVRSLTPADGYACVCCDAFSACPGCTTPAPKSLTVTDQVLGTSASLTFTPAAPGAPEAWRGSTDYAYTGCGNKGCGDGWPATNVRIDYVWGMTLVGQQLACGLSVSYYSECQPGAGPKLTLSYTLFVPMTITSCPENGLVAVSRLAPAAAGDVKTVPYASGGPCSQPATPGQPLTVFRITE